MTDEYAVIGNPVEHSKSPLIHSLFAVQTGHEIHYGKLLCGLDDFAETVKTFFASGGKGLNVTVPFKQQAFELAVQRSEPAQLAGAVNTLMLDHSGLIAGHNTDGIGLVRDITRNLHGILAQKSILVLGAGGAARGILQPLLEQGPAGITVANRTVARAAELAQGFHPMGKVAGCGFADLSGQQFDWIINASSSSLHGELPQLPAGVLKTGGCCYDLMYGSKPTMFCQWAQKNGATLVADGLGMLVEQAAESFWLWRGVRPDTGPVIRELASNPN